jgi:hypothetical protein
MVVAPLASPAALSLASSSSFKLIGFALIVYRSSGGSCWVGLDHRKYHDLLRTKPSLVIRRSSLIAGLWRSVFQHNNGENARMNATSAVRTRRFCSCNAQRLFHDTIDLQGTMETRLSDSLRKADTNANTHQMNGTF